MIRTSCLLIVRISSPLVQGGIFDALRCENAENPILSIGFQAGDRQPADRSRNEIVLEEEMKAGEVREVELHDGSVVILKKLD